MKSKGPISPDVIENLCGTPRRIQQRTECEHPPTPVSESKPKKKGLWNKVNKFCKKATKVCRKVTKLIRAISVGILSVVAVIKAATGFKNASRKFAAAGV